MVTCVGCTPPENFWNLKPGNAISPILSIQKIIKLLTIIYHHLVVEKRNSHIFEISEDDHPLNIVGNRRERY
jgi:hypothetical protein